MIFGSVSIFRLWMIWIYLNLWIILGQFEKNNNTKQMMIYWGNVWLVWGLTKTSRLNRSNFWPITKLLCILLLQLLRLTRSDRFSIDEAGFAPKSNFKALSALLFHNHQTTLGKIVEESYYSQEMLCTSSVARHGEDHAKGRSTTKNFVALNSVELYSWNFSIEAVATKVCRHQFDEEDNVQPEQLDQVNTSSWPEEHFLTVFNQNRKILQKRDRRDKIDFCKKFAEIHLNVTKPFNLLKFFWWRARGR